MEKRNDASKQVVDAIGSGVIACAYVEKTKDEDKAIFLRVAPELKRRWAVLCAQRNVKQNAAGKLLIQWAVSAPEALQAHILSNAPLNEQSVREIVAALRHQLTAKTAADIKDGGPTPFPRRK